MWEGWKDIESYLYFYDPIPYSLSTTYSFDDWIPLSNYGIMRGRPQITGSSRNGSSISIPSRNGVVYPLDVTQGNAKVSIEVLVADVWTHPSTGYKPAIKRADSLSVMAKQAKYFAYKEPGRSDKDSYFIIRDAKVAITDADAKCQIVKIDFEVAPVRYWITGLYADFIGEGNNLGLSVYNNCPDVNSADNKIYFRSGTNALTRDNSFTEDYCLHYERNSEIIRPTFVFRFTSEGKKSGTISRYLNRPDGTWYDHKTMTVTNVDSGTVLDTNKGLAWCPDEHGTFSNVNQKFDGDYDLFWLPVGRRARYHATNDMIVYMYTNEGMII